MGYYMYFTMFLFPLAAVLIALLMLPVWGRLRRWVLNMVDKVLFFKIVVMGYESNLYTFVSIVATFTFLIASVDVYRSRNLYLLAKLNGRHDEHIMIKKFLTERNWWLSLFALTLWIFLYRIRAYTKEVSHLETQLEHAKRSVLELSTHVGPSAPDGSPAVYPPKDTKSPAIARAEPVALISPVATPQSPLRNNSAESLEPKKAR